MIAELEAEFAGLVLARFTESEALALGQTLLELGHGKPIVISIRSLDRPLFYAALPGSAPMNEVWARRKGNCALFFQLPSLLVGEKNRTKGDTLALHGLNMADYADHGGAVPIKVANCGVVGVATISGLPSIEDHRLVVAGLRALIRPQ